MSRDQVAEVKDKTDIVSLISEHVVLTKAGRHFKGLCPFHQERTSSFVVSPELQIFKCFGCGESGDCYSFLEKYEGMEFSEALKFLADRVGIKLETNQFPQTSEKEKVYKINELGGRFYNFLLFNHPIGKKALSYAVEKRGMSLETMKTFMVGFAPQGSFLADFLIKKKKLKAEDVEKAGLILKGRSGYFDRFGGRLTFPISDQRGNYSALAGRILPELDNGRTGKYINSPETVVYHKSASLYGINVTRVEIKKAKKVIVVEGELDLISSWQAGVKNVVAIKGSALTEEQAKILARLCGEVILALDSDWAGNEAAIKGIKVISELGLSIKVARFKKYKDPDEAARGDVEYYKKCLDEAVGVWDFLIASVFESMENKTGNGKANISRKVVPLLSQIPDTIVQAHYVKIVADRLSVPEDAVWQQMKVPATTSSNTKSGEVKQTTVFNRRETLENQLLRVSLRVEPDQFLDEDFKNIFKAPFSRRVIGEIEKFFGKNNEFDLGVFIKEVPKELQDGLSSLILKEEDMTNEALVGEKKLLFEQVLVFDLKMARDEVAKKISEFEKLKDKAAVRKLEKEFDLLTKKILTLDLG